MRTHPSQRAGHPRILPAILVTRQDKPRPTGVPRSALVVPLVGRRDKTGARHGRGRCRVSLSLYNQRLSRESNHRCKARVRMMQGFGLPPACLVGIVWWYRPWMADRGTQRRLSHLSFGPAVLRTTDGCLCLRLRNKSILTGRSRSRMTRRAGRSYALSKKNLSIFRWVLFVSCAATRQYFLLVLFLFIPKLKYLSALTVVLSPIQPAAAHETLLLTLSSDRLMNQVSSALHEATSHHIFVSLTDNHLLSLLRLFPGHIIRN